MKDVLEIKNHQCNIPRDVRVQLINVNTILYGGSRASATSKMECFVIIVNDFQPLTIITKHSILDVAAALDLPLVVWRGNNCLFRSQNLEFEMFKIF